MTTVPETPKFAIRRLAGRKVYRVPIIRCTDGKTSYSSLRGADQQGGSLFYDRPDSGLLVVTADGYLRNRKYAEFVGLAEYSPDGLDH